MGCKKERIVNAYKVRRKGKSMKFLTRSGHLQRNDEVVRPIQRSI